MKTVRWAPQKQSGFTIVELLIVIVVIAILAAVTIVAYNGIQARAQQARVASEMNATTKKLELYNVDNTLYPQSVSDCPSPAATNICLTPSDGETYRYQAFTPGGSGYMIVNNNSYELTILGSSQFLYSSNAERHGSNEFMQYTDLGPTIDQYGLGKYQLSFDIKSASIASQSTVRVYFQNGSTARYGGLQQDVPVTTSYTHQVLTFTPVMNNSSVSASMLAFYGTYSSGNVPTVKNLKVQLAP